MTRAQAISTVESELPSLSDERIELLAEVDKAWSRPTLWSTLPLDERAKADQAVDSLDRGEGTPLADVEAELDVLLAVRQK